MSSRDIQVSMFSETAQTWVVTDQVGFVKIQSRATRKWDITPKWDTARQEALMQLAAYEGGVLANLHMGSWQPLSKQCPGSLTVVGTVNLTIANGFLAMQQLVLGSFAWSTRNYSISVHAHIGWSLGAITASESANLYRTVGLDLLKMPVLQ